VKHDVVGHNDVKCQPVPWAWVRLELKGQKELKEPRAIKSNKAKNCRLLSVKVTGMSLETRPWSKDWTAAEDMVSGCIVSK
jgi:hypothetical protein